MKARYLRALWTLVLLPLVAAACETSKSANPLSPSVAGPIPGVEITAPKPLAPQQNASVKSDQQPLTLTVENASSTGQRPLNYRVEVAADAGFSTMVYSKDGITPGGNGRTSVQVADMLAADRTYFWRMRAQDGANTGPFSDTLKFSVVTPVTIGGPGLVFPAPGETVDANPPTLIFANPDITGPASGIKYALQIATDQAFTQIVFSETGTPQSNQTRVTPGAALLPATTFYWRVRVSAGDVTGPWSPTGSFKTPAGSSEPPPPPPGGGGGGGGGGNPGNCASRDGHFIVDCISDKYASYRRAGVSAGTRRSNMEFLRNRIIEAGICGGLDLGWNLKRGGPDLSVDFIVDRRGGQEIGVDIARDYDNTGKVLQLTWAEDGPGSHYKSYSPRPSCN
jgi:hypothetical protein